ncbi:unnamed protein product [Polarella glacialis]|uniref:Uncharacterized protein n=1 Tax=Polarella glacialis TaxID=89957 RepID=A0A813GPS1_POLGL|nr:unnamed protein product [Polarella glacialis]
MAALLSSPAVGHAGGLPGGTSASRIFNCAHDPAWSFFREKLQAATNDGQLRLEPELLETAQALAEQLDQAGGLAVGAEHFYQDLCSDQGSSFCLYGVVSVLFVIAAGIHSSVLGSPGDPKQAQEYLRMATSMLGLQYCLDFQESTIWPLRANDVLFNLNRSAGEPFRLAPRTGPEPLARSTPPGSSLYPWPPTELARSLSLAVRCQREVNLVPVGTHPTLTLEAVSMLRDFAFASGQVVNVRRTLGITYKCAVFPDMCAEGIDSGVEDPVAALIGRFEAPPPYESYTFARIAEALEVVGRELLSGKGFDILVCTSPFVVCALLQRATDKPMLGYLGLPLLWKRPTDHFDNATARKEFWALLPGLLARPDVVLATNNPVLTEQIAYQAPQAILPVVRPHARFTRATYAPTRLREAMLVSRTKFLWVTLGCALRHFMSNEYPITFTIANSDSKFEFREMAAHRAVVLVPWEHALMAFYEFYSMSVPLLMPAASWAYRLVFDADGNLGSTTSVYKDISDQCDQEAGCDPARHPYPPFAFASFESRRYWYQYTSFVQFPHVTTFSSIPDLLLKLPALDLSGISSSMKAFNDETFIRSTAFWRNAAKSLLTTRSGRHCAAVPDAPGV